jgi:arsenate reductase
MRVLTVCKHNAGRSQMASAILARYRPDWQVASAGVGPDLRGTHVPDSVVAILDEIGITLLPTTERVLITEDLVAWADLIIMIVDPDLWPDYLDRQKTIGWAIDDPRGKSAEILRATRDEIIIRCQSLAGDTRSDTRNN